MIIKTSKGIPVARYDEDGKLYIKGKGLSDTILDFWLNLNNWGSQLQIDKLTVEVDLDTLQSFSYQHLLAFIKALDNNSQIHKMVVIWHYEMGVRDSLLSTRHLSKSLRKARFKYRLNTDGY